MGKGSYNFHPLFLANNFINVNLVLSQRIVEFGGIWGIHSHCPSNRHSSNNHRSVNKSYPTDLGQFHRRI